MEEKNKRQRQTINVDQGQIDKIKPLAKRERRAIAQMVRVLLDEALQERSRNKVRPSKALNDSLYSWSTEDIQGIAETAIRILAERIPRSGELEASNSSPDSPFALEVQKHMKGCKKAWKGMPGGIKRLEAIASGEKPTDEELMVLEACLPIETTLLQDLVKEAFGNHGTNSDHQECNGGCGK